MKKTKILIKGSFIIPRHSKDFIAGIGRSTIELVTALTKLDDPQLELSLYSCSPIIKRFNFYGWSISCHQLFRPEAKLSFLFDIIEYFFRHFIWKSDLIHFTANKEYTKVNEKFVLTIHDLIQFENNKDRENLIRSASLASGIITCSEFTKNEIVRLIHVPKEKIKVSYWGINHNLFYPRSYDRIQKIKTKYNIKYSYFFSCSFSSMRKNPDITFAAFRELLKTSNDISLVISWYSCPRKFYEEYRKEIENGNIIIIKGVSDEELACLYSGALASILISSSEGFGFPVLESFACGTPCITCKNSSLAEIGRDKAYFVKERDVDDTCLALKYFVKYGKGNTNSLIYYAKQFTWEKCAKEYLEFYKQTLRISSI